MTAAALQSRALDEERRSEELRQQSEAAVKRIHEAAERIRRMTKLYQERLQGIRRAQ